MRTDIFVGLIDMSEKKDGIFSSSLLSLQLQLKTLLEGAGGDAALTFLDTLSTLNPSEQKLILGLFTTVVERVKSGEDRLETEEDQHLKEFEETLYRDILDSMREAANDTPNRKIEVLEGGKSRNRIDKTPIDLAEARKSRRRSKQLLN
jgi:hypothetical protein